jgi:hypothetical protein
MNKDILRWVLFGNTLLLLSSFAVSLYVQWKVLPKVEEQLKNCKIVTDAKAFWGTGLRGWSHRYVMVNLALTSTRLLQRKGLVDVNEVNNISNADRRWICIPMQVDVVTLAVVFAYNFRDKFC